MARLRGAIRGAVTTNSAPEKPEEDTAARQAAGPWMEVGPKKPRRPRVSRPSAASSPEDTITSETPQAAPRVRKTVLPKPTVPSAETDAAPVSTSTRKKPAVESPAPPSPQRTAAPLPRPFRGYRAVREEGCEAEVRAPMGVFYPFDGETVAFYCKDPATIRRIRRRWNGDVRVFVEGDDEATLHLPATLYPEVATLCGVAHRGR